MNAIPSEEPAMIRRPLAALALAAAVALPLAAPTEAVAQTRDIRVSGMGVRKCSEWTQWKTEQKGEQRATAIEWAQGFIAGHNIYARINNQPAASVVADSRILLPLLDTYCQQYPDNRLFSGMLEIIANLGGARINLAPKAPTKPNPAPEKKGPQES
jgi:hypothetical protein